LAYGKTSGNTPFRLNLHVGDVGHTAVVGPTGAGKSTFLALLAAQHRRYPRARQIIFDKGRSSFVLAHAVGGRHYDLAVAGDMAFCPLKAVHEPEERAWAAEWIETLLVLQGIPVTPEHRQLILQALQRLAASPEGRSFTHFVTQLQDAQLRSALQYYTLGGVTGGLLDAEEDSIVDRDFQVFELETIMSAGEKTLAPLLLYLFRQIERGLDGRPTLIILDECWVMLANPIFVEKIGEWLRTLRRKNAMVVMATQELAAFVGSTIKDIVLTNCPSTVLLPNLAANNSSTRPFYESVLGMSQREIELVATATPKQDYYIRSPEGRRVISFDLGPVALSFCATSSQEDIAAARQLIGQAGEDWPAQWLEQRGLSDWAAYWRRAAA
jgi:type IV secretion system protein VirB4